MALCISYQIHACSREAPPRRSHSSMLPDSVDCEGRVRGRWRRCRLGSRVTSLASFRRTQVDNHDVAELKVPYHPSSLVRICPRLCGSHHLSVGVASQAWTAGMFAGQRHVKAELALTGPLEARLELIRPAVLIKMNHLL